jgi:hypothetical protein
MAFLFFGQFLHFGPGIYYKKEFLPVNLRRLIILGKFLKVIKNPIFTITQLF